MSLPKTTIQYLKSCFEHDNRGNLISNIFSSKISARKFFKTGDFFCDWNELFLLDSTYAVNVLKDLQLHVSEKELRVGLFFINFESLVMGKTLNNVCPLFLFDATIMQDEFYFLSLKKESFEINPAALKVLEGELGENSTQFAKEIELLITNSNGFDEGLVIQIQRLFDQFSNVINTEELIDYPGFIKQKELKKPKEQITIRSAACIFVQEKTKNTQSVLNELDRLLAPETQYSRLLLNYLNQSFELRNINEDSLRFIKAPAILSEAQTGILREISNNQCLVVTGPPGTGKSFTIAAAAINEALNGKSVLIATGSDHANNAIEQKIKEDFKLSNISARISKNRSYKAILNRNLKKWLEGVELTRGTKNRSLHATQIKKIEQRLNEIEIQLYGLIEDEIKLGYLVHEYRRGLINKIKSFFLKLSVDRIMLHPLLIDEYLELTKELVRIRRSYLIAAQKEIIKNSINTNRRLFQHFREALNTKASGSVMELFDKIDFNILTNVFPVWISTVNDIGTGLPMHKEMFDIVIVDEASQIDMATILPIFQRAKKVIICGDTEQLSPVTFLSSGKQKNIASKCGDDLLAKRFNYNKDSFLDICHKSIKDQSQLFFLDEHYRSLPDIISFSNRNFYNNELRIMTQLPQNADKKGLHFEYCEGIRTQEGINEKEALALISEIEKIINDAASEIEFNPKSKPSSIGILSPFRKQVNYLEKMISDKLDLKQIQQHRIVCGTAHTFQGNERDIMFISTVVDDHAHHGAFMHINKHDVFNVSITRARNKQFVLHSLTKNCKFKDHLLYEYLFENDLSIQDSIMETDDDLSLEKVTEWLKQHFDVQEYKIDYVIAGINIDIWAKINNRYYGFDAIGFPGNFETAVNIGKLKILSRLGIKIIPVSISNFLYHQEELKSVIAESLS